MSSLRTYAAGMRGLTGSTLRASRYVFVIRRWLTVDQQSLAASCCNLLFVGSDGKCEHTDGQRYRSNTTSPLGLGKPIQQKCDIYQQRATARLGRPDVTIAIIVFSYIVSVHRTCYYVFSLSSHNGRFPRCESSCFNAKHASSSDYHPTVNGHLRNYSRRQRRPKWRFYNIYAAPVNRPSPII